MSTIFEPCRQLRRESSVKVREGHVQADGEPGIAGYRFRGRHGGGPRSWDDREEVVRRPAFVAFLLSDMVDILGSY